MRLSLRMKAACVGTPLQGPLESLRWYGKVRKRHRHPELAEIYYEGRVVKKLLELILRPDSNVVDIGAHIGSFLARAERLAPNGSHHAFEAIPEKARVLQRRFKSTIHPVALAAESGESEFFVSRRRPGFSSLATSGHIPDAVPIKVQVRRLDDELSRDYEPDLIKLDVEGAEILVLEGAPRVLSRGPMLLFESAPDGAVRFGRHPTELYELLHCAGYKIFLPKEFIHNREPLSIEQFSNCHRFPFRAFNYFARVH